MIKDKRGTKRLCESCGKKFYDLGRDPTVCPICDAPFIIEKPKPKPKPKAAPAPADKVADKVAEPIADAALAPEDAALAPEDAALAPEDAALAPEDAALAPEDAALAPEDAAPAPEDAAPAPAPEPEFVSLEDAAEEEEGDDEAKLADLGDDEADIPPDDNQDVFLEDDEEDGESKLTEIIGAPIETKDET
ncbi:protein of unknown function [bacterium BMS3Bbin10]|nr:protein of unknown function [bacterium BMS3Bbin10]HDL16831.1 hypothetical protein [Hyphomicrobiales bacterium]